MGKELTMLDMKGGPFADLLSIAEAAEIWGKEQSTLRKAIHNMLQVLLLLWVCSF